MAIELDNITSGYSTGLINNNFQEIEEELNNNVLRRDGVGPGEANEMRVPLDMNSNPILNLPAPAFENQAARLKDVQNAIAGISEANLTKFTPYGNIGAENVQGAIQELADGTGQSVTTSTGNQTLEEALEDRVNKGEVGVESVTTETGEGSLTEALDLRLSQVQSSVQVTVGAGADFVSINDALEHLSKRRAIHTSLDKVEATILLVSGYVMQEQVLVEGQDFSWVIIQSEDPQVTISRSAITESFGTSTDDTVYPVFGVMNGTLPIMDCLFSMDETGVGDDRHGVVCWHNSRFMAKENSGVVNCGGNGLDIRHGSIASVRRTNWYDSGRGSNGGQGIYCANSSRAEALGVDCRNAGMAAGGGSGSGGNGVYANQCSHVSARSGDVRGCARNGFYANQGSVLNCRGGDATGCGLNSIRALAASTVNALDATCDDAGAEGVYANQSSTINANGASANNATTDGFRAIGGSSIDAAGGSATGCGNCGAFLSNSAVGNFSGATLTNANADGILCVAGSFVNARNTDGSGAGNFGFRVNWGGIIAADSATGSLNQTANSVTQFGIIFQ